LTENVKEETDVFASSMAKQWQTLHTSLLLRNLAITADMQHIKAARQKEILAARGMEAKLHDRVIDELRIMLESQKASIDEAHKVSFTLTRELSVSSRAPYWCSTGEALF